MVLIGIDFFTCDLWVGLVVRWCQVVLLFSSPSQQEMLIREDYSVSCPSSPPDNIIIIRRPVTHILNHTQESRPCFVIGCFITHRIARQWMWLAYRFEQIHIFGNHSLKDYSVHFCLPVIFLRYCPLLDNSARIYPLTCGSNEDFVSLWHWLLSRPALSQEAQSSHGRSAGGGWGVMTWWTPPALHLTHSPPPPPPASFCPGRENEGMLSDRQWCTPRMWSMSLSLPQFTSSQQTLCTHQPFTLSNLHSNTQHAVCSLHLSLFEGPLHTAVSRIRIQNTMGTQWHMSITFTSETFFETHGLEL